MLHFDFNMDGDQNQASAPGKRVALGVTGGIAAYKAIEVLRGLQRAGCEVRVAMTRHACEFVQPLTFRALSGSYVLVDDYAPDNPDPIAHITFSQTVDLADRGSGNGQYPRKIRERRSRRLSDVDIPGVHCTGAGRAGDEHHDVGASCDPA